MSFNASNFLLSLSDLFVIIIPGLMMLGLAAIVFWWGRESFERTCKRLVGGAWVVLLVASFLVGQFVSHVGSQVEDAYWRNKLDDIANEYPVMRQSVMKLASAALAPEVKVTAIDARRWAAVLLRQKDARFGERIDRLDVQRRFFRNMIVVFLIAAVLALARTIATNRKGKSKRRVYMGLCVLFVIACTLSTTRYFYENKRFTKDIFENFIAASLAAPAKAANPTEGSK